MVTGGINIYNSRRITDGTAYWFKKENVTLNTLDLPMLDTGEISKKADGIFEYTIVSSKNYSSNDYGGMVRALTEQFTIRTSDDINGIIEGSYVYLWDSEEWYVVTSIQKIMKTRTRLLSKDPDCIYTLMLRR